MRVSVPIIENMNPEDTPMVRFPCPSCGKKSKAPENAIGKIGTCPTCDH